MGINQMYNFDKASEHIFSEYNIISYYTILISSEIKNMFSFNNLCHCKKQILEIKWNYWLRWWLAHSAYIMRDDIKLNKLDLQHYKDNIEKTKLAYHRELSRNSFISQSMLNLFQEIHSVIMDEFEMIIPDMLGDPKITKAEYLSKLGHLLHIICLNSIFEMAEINFSCDAFADKEPTRTSSYCDFHLTTGTSQSPSLRLIINKMYNINTYAQKKIDKIIEKLRIDDTFRIILDFKYYKEPITIKIENMYKYLINIFKNVDIVNLPENKTSKLLKIGDNR